MSTSSLRFPFPVVGPSRTPLGHPPTSGEEGTHFLIRPPYRKLELHPSFRALERHAHAPGSIAGIRIRSGTEWSRVQPLVASLRSSLPDAAIVLLLPGGSGVDLMLSARAARGGVRAVLVEEEGMQERLRTALTCRDSLAEDVVEWLGLRRLRLSPTVASLLREIFTHAPGHPDLTTLLAGVGMAESSARFRLHKRLLPTPSRWFQVARALHCALRVQAEPRTSLLHIAHEFGFADHSALSQLIFRAFQVRPGVVRGTLGWEWLMHRWIRAIPEGAHTTRTP